MEFLEIKNIFRFLEKFYNLFNFVIQKYLINCNTIYFRFQRLQIRIFLNDSSFRDINFWFKIFSEILKKSFGKNCFFFLTLNKKNLYFKKLFKIEIK